MNRTAGSSLVLLLAALTLGACQTGRQGAPAISAPPPAPAPAAPAPQVAAIPPQPAVNDDPGQLLGLDRDGLAALLGSPSLVRREAPAEIWQYVTTGCVFDVVLYARGEVYAVTYLEARDAAATVQEPRPCLNRLLRDRQTAPVS